MIREKIKDVEERQKRDKILKLSGLPKRTEQIEPPPKKRQRYNRRKLKRRYDSAH